MPKFKDAKDREWDLALNVGLLGKLRKEAGFDLGKNTTAERLSETLFADPEMIVRVLWVLCESQAEKTGVSPEEFGYGFDGPSINSAITAFIEAIIDFFHRPAAATAMKAKLPQMMGSFDQKVQTIGLAAMDQAISILNDSAGVLPESSAWMPSL